MDHTRQRRLGTHAGSLSGLTVNRSACLCNLQQAVEQGGSIASLAPVFADALSRLNEIGALQFKNPAAQIRLQHLLSGVHIAATFIAAFFATRLNQAQAALAHPRPAKLERAVCWLKGMPYDRQRIDEARATLRAGGAEAGARAVCHYFQIGYDAHQLALIRQYAAQA